MTQLGEAIARYHKILETEPYRNSEWVKPLREQMAARGLLLNGRPVTPVLRPHFLSRRQYTNLAKTAESLMSAIDRVRAIALSTPALLSRMELLPAEKMLAAVDPGYQWPTVTALLDTQVNNGSLHFTDSSADQPYGVVYGEILAELFYEAGPVKEFRKRYKLAKAGGAKPLIAAVLKAYKDYGGKAKPSIAILEFKQPFQTAETLEMDLLAELFRAAGYAARTLTPEELEYRDGVLRSGDFKIDVVFRGVKAHEFLLRYDLTHPLVRAYRERKVCVVNSFRSELSGKKALFHLLTDDAITDKFPASEKKAIRDSIPWTRVVTQSKTTHGDKTVDLTEFILQNREKLMLRPNDDSSEQPTIDGGQTDEAGWERALKTALRSPYVVQERVATEGIMFPVEVYGEVSMRELTVDVQPQTFLGKVHGCSSRIASASGGFSTLSGVAPTFILEAK
jgi:hypothetical protein